MVVQGHVTHERLRQIFTAGESVSCEHTGNAPIEALHHAIRSGRAWLGQAVFNAQGTVGQTLGYPWPGAHGLQTTCR